MISDPRLALVEDLVFYPGSYEWACVGVFRRASDGALFWGADRGCSCHEPWDDLRPEHLEPFKEESLDDFRTEAMDRAGTAAEKVEAAEYCRRMEQLLHA